MQGASSDSLQALTEALGAAVEGGADASRSGDDLFAVSEVLRREPGLRRVATDLSVTPEAKSGLLRGIFGEQLDPASTDLVATAARRRWAATRDLPDALEHLGVVAVVRGAEQKGKADELENELFAFERLVSASPELRDSLSDPARDVADKRRLLRDLLDGKATSATLRLAEQAVSGSHRTVGSTTTLRCTGREYCAASASCSRFCSWPSRSRATRTVATSRLRCSAAIFW